MFRSLEHILGRWILQFIEFKCNNDTFCARTDRPSKIGASIAPLSYDPGTTATQSMVCAQCHVLTLPSRVANPRSWNQQDCETYSQLKSSDLPSVFEAMKCQGKNMFHDDGTRSLCKAAADVRFFQVY